ncbi:MCE family protein [Corticibacter populi]|uniref:MCE family protein n=1 Tax=Corticibacter populi TaxID=1550736 RepID=A0A3M6R0P1_9BURK|nr:MlaD family protein [Corticibacter populi]RMX08775.1 MCE family protein [Corticibacter populi]RZS36134.1 phospholipid/cholesterol/gamma-HCH transport system substrate-binding protein [Corticibacter populi]
MTDNRPSPEPAPAPRPDTRSSLGLPLIAPVRHLHIKSMLLMLVTLLLTLGAFGYLLYARGVFEEKQTLILTAEDSEGIAIGMDLTFSGFPIGSVRQIELTDTGGVRIIIDVPEKNAHRLRESSIFTMVRNVLGSTSLKAYTGVWDDPPLPDMAERPVLYGDASAEIPQLMASARTLLSNLAGLTASDSDLASSLAHLNQLSAALGGSGAEGGALQMLLGNGTEAQQLQSALQQANTLLQRLNRIAGRADEQVFGQSGLMRDAHAATRQLDALLAETRTSLRQLDAILGDAKTISGNVSNASEDLDELRAEIERNLRRIDSMMAHLQDLWPLRQNHRIELP